MPSSYLDIEQKPIHTVKLKYQKKNLRVLFKTIKLTNGSIKHIPQNGGINGFKQYE